MGLLYCDCVDANEDTEELERQNRALAEPRPRPADPGGTIDGHEYGSDPNPDWMMAGLVGNARNYRP